MLKYFLLLIIILIASNVWAADSARIAVASNMSNIRTQLTSGSSGNFARQIIQGAPYSLFLSADKKYVDLLRANDIEIVEQIQYVRGRIGLFVSKTSELSRASDLKSVIKKLYHGNFNRLVIANPMHAPYGLAAEQALQSAGLWVIEKHRLLLAENAAQATQITVSGNVDLGIISASHAHLQKVQTRGQFFLIPEQWHQPLQQYLLVLEGANEAEMKLFKYLQSKQAQLLLKIYGYTPSLLIEEGEAYGLASP
jgi:molybdate transport system substrate-binding protein